MSPVDPYRRRFLGSAVATLAAAELARIGTVYAQSAKVKQIDAGLLNIGYVEAGPSGGAPVILLHGWPYDIHAFDEVTPLLAAAGHRVLVPYLRGYGTTRFLSDTAFRN